MEESNAWNRGVYFAELAFPDMGGDNLVIIVCLAITSTMAIFSAIRNSNRFWNYFAALAIATVMAVLLYWVRSALFEANIQDYNMRASGGMPPSGSAYFGHLNLILQSMIGVFMMITALLVRRSRGPSQPS